MRSVHPAAIEAMDEAAEHAGETSARIERAQQREHISIRLLAQSREDLRRSRARLAELAMRGLNEGGPGEVGSSPEDPPGKSTVEL
jgi:hypothetical protein